MNAVLMPNRSTPLTASSAPSIRHRDGSTNPGTSNVVMVPSEYSDASVNEPNAPSHRYADAQSVLANPVQCGQYQRDRSDVADHDRDRAPRIVQVPVGTDPNPPFETECQHHDSGRVDRDGQHDEQQAQGPTRQIHAVQKLRRGNGRERGINATDKLG